jgi:hypothetical protein
LYRPSRLHPHRDRHVSSLLLVAVAMSLMS